MSVATVIQVRIEIQRKVLEMWLSAVKNMLTFCRKNHSLVVWENCHSHIYNIKIVQLTEMRFK